MKIAYDAEVDVLYIRFVETTVTTKHVDEGISIDYDTDGRVAGIEILDAKERFGETDIFQNITFEGLSAAAK